MDPFEYSSSISLPFSSSTFDSSSFPSSPRSLASLGSPRHPLVELEEAAEEASPLGDALLQEVAAAWESGGEKSVHAWIVGAFRCPTGLRPERRERTMTADKTFALVI
jgi:hypothetical protein